MDIKNADRVGFLLHEREVLKEVLDHRDGDFCGHFKFKYSSYEKDLTFYKGELRNLLFDTISKRLLSIENELKKL